MSTTHLRTKNLRDLSNLVPVASAKPGNSIVTTFNKMHSHHTESRIFKNLTFAEFKQEVFRMIHREYDSANSYNIQNINSIFTTLYGKPLRFREAPSELILKIKRMIQKTGLSVDQLVNTIRQYLGYPCSFFRQDGDRTVPITSERLLKAHELITQKASIVKVEDALYF